MNKRLAFLIVLAAFLALYAADAWMAAKYSPAVTAALLRTLNKADSPVRATLQAARFHPLFLTLEADGMEVFDIAESGSRVLSAHRVRLRPTLFALLKGRRDLSLLAVEQAEINIQKDPDGVFNWERLAQFASSDDQLYGWKYQDWLFNLYERLRRKTRQADQPRQPGTPVQFSIAHFRLQGRAILSDRLMDPLIVDNLEIRFDHLKWLADGDLEWKSILTQGKSRSKRPGQFNLRLQWQGNRLRGAARLHQVNLVPLLPLYASSTPVFFEKGYLTLQSELLLDADSLDSHHHVKIQDHLMRPTVPWSPESSVVLGALNRHRVLDIHFAVRGDPERPLFSGAAESLTKILKKDFNPYVLSLISTRIKEEVDKLSLQFS